jgi:hypothetical protein
MPEVRTTGPTNSWRLVHDGAKVLHLFESGGYTSTIWNLEEFPTKEAAEARIAELKLVPLVEGDTERSN